MSIMDWFKRKPATQGVEVKELVPVEPTYLMTNDGNITLRWHGKTHSIGKAHRNYEGIVNALVNKETSRLDSLVDAAVQVERAIEGVTVNEYGEVFYRGTQAHGVIADKIGEFVRAKLPYKPLARFLGNLMENPSEESRQELYLFLQHKGFPVTHDGCFMAYKGIRKDWKDIHTGSFDNSIGSAPVMDRKDVDTNRSVTCSRGFHVGTHEYATSFGRGGRVVLVKVNPRDAVSVPADHNDEKLRVCTYEVVEECPGLVTEPIYRAPNESSDYEDEDTCPSCGDSECWDMECEEEEECPDCGDIDCPGGCETSGLDIEEEDNIACGDEPAAVAVKIPKRAACTYCGAKGGKRHADNCRRPQKV